MGAVIWAVGPAAVVEGAARCGFETCGAHPAPPHPPPRPGRLRASAKCQAEKRKTINGDDLLWAMETLQVRGGRGGTRQCRVRGLFSYTPSPGL